VKRLLAIAAPFLVAGCATQSDVRKPLQEHLLVTGKVMGFALDAQMEALETKLAVVEADPRLEAKLGKPEEIRKKIERLRGDQLAIQAELKQLKDRYALDDEGH
jgi:hypothetical protein